MTFYYTQTYSKPAFPRLNRWYACCVQARRPCWIRAEAHSWSVGAGVEQPIHMPCSKRQIHQRPWSHWLRACRWTDSEAAARFSAAPLPLRSSRSATHMEGDAAVLCEWRYMWTVKYATRRWHAFSVCDTHQSASRIDDPKGSAALWACMHRADRLSIDFHLAPQATPTPTRFPSHHDATLIASPPLRSSAAHSPVLLPYRSSCRLRLWPISEAAKCSSNAYCHRIKVNARSTSSR